MFGVGYQEMLLIGLAALLLFGPGKMPEMMSQAGKWYKQFRDVTSELSGEFNKTVAEAKGCLLYTSPSPRDKRQSRMPSSA